MIRRSSNSRKYPRPGRGPQFEVLEKRLALACSAAVVDSVLMIEGDKLGNDIDVVIDGSGESLSASVVCDGEKLDVAELGKFNSVAIEGNEGNDNIDVQVKDLAAGSGEIIDLQIEGNDGDDFISVTAYGLNASSGGLISIEAEGGQGNDSVAGTFDLVAVGPKSTINLDVDGGQQDDDVMLSLGSSALGKPTVQVQRGGVLQATAESDDGDDKLAFYAKNIDVAGRAELTAESGKGNDAVAFGLSNVNLQQSGTLMTHVEGGTGNDSIDVIARDLNLAGVVLDSVQGGRGDDMIRIVMDDIAVHKSATIKMIVEGNRGKDSITTDLGPNMKIDPGATVAMDFDP